jgi:GT2 family glycosyltransferase
MSLRESSPPHADNIENKPSAGIRARPDIMPPSSEPTVSIVIATYARYSRLVRCIENVRRNVRIAHEIVVVGGGAGDGTEEWLARQTDVRFIRETKREGATRAYNKGFRAATGVYVMWLNDDSYPLPGAVEAAVRMIERPDLSDVGMVAFYHNYDRQWNRTDSVERDGQSYGIYNVRGALYANFGLLRRSLLERLGYLDERYYFCAWDPDLSLKVEREAGLRVIGCREALVYHEELIDERKSADLSIAEADNAKLFSKWKLPEKFAYPDPAPAYQTFIRQRALV